LPVIYCKNALKLKLTKKYNLLVLVHFYSKVLATVLPVFYCKKPGKVCGGLEKTVFVGYVLLNVI